MPATISPACRPRRLVLPGAALELARAAALALALALAPGGGAATAAELTVAVADQAGRPVVDAVVMLEPAAGQGTGAWQAPPAVMRQQGMLFDPFVLPVRVGATVSFPNLDDFRHHVYSFSPTRRFELRLYGKDETNTERFDKAGVVALGCNIHDNMLSYILVTAHPAYAVTDAAGVARFAGLPAGPWATFAWHPDLDGERGERGGPPVALAEDAVAAAAISVSLRAARRSQGPPQEGAYR